ncbi:MAG: hypothetical protein LWW95_11520 [Candidatus Desulfofervidus auxilii]|nr:hypothetical protein [Candidatus Desulfofervidus auxilii]
MDKKEIKNVYEQLQELIVKLQKTFENACPTFVPAPPELTRCFNNYLKKAQTLCPEHDGIQLLDCLDERSCKMGQLLRASLTLSDFLSEELK